MSSKIRLQDVVSATVGREMGVWAREGCGSGGSAMRLDLAGKGKIEEIRVELALGPTCFFKNQAVKISR